jgi:hypothetical protein
MPSTRSGGGEPRQGGVHPRQQQAAFAAERAAGRGWYGARRVVAARVGERDHLARVVAEAGRQLAQQRRPGHRLRVGEAPEAGFAVDQQVERGVGEVGQPGDRSGGAPTS